MSETRIRWGRLREWWWGLTVVAAVLSFVCGFGLTLFVKFTGYYLAEQTSIATLNSEREGSVLLVKRAEAIEAQLLRINQLLAEQHFLNEADVGKLGELADHVHALDARADADRNLLTDFLGQQKKNNEQILWLLDRRAIAK